MIQHGVIDAEKQFCERRRLAEEAREVAECRHCKRVLKGKPYYRGGSAYHPDTGERCKVNFYGGFVCSARCDYQASLELEQSMPGHGCQQKSISGSSLRSYRSNWGDQ